jgi:lysozyme
MSPAIALIKKFEGCCLTTYLCPAGIPTIGYGHTGPDVQMGMTITQEQADGLLNADLEEFSAGVDAAVKVTINANQRGALISFAYNCGLNNLRHSTLIRKVNSENHAAAAAQFGKWNMAGGKVLPGLVTRRAAEAALYQEEI